MVPTQECCILSWIQPGSSISQNSSRMNSYLPMQKSFKTNKNMQETTGEAGTNSLVTFSGGLLYRDTQVLADQQILTFINSVRTLDAV